MNHYVKSVAKDLMPPAMLRWLRRRGDKANAWDSVKLGRDGITVGREGLILPGGKVFQCRDSYADAQVCRQIFLNREYSFDSLARAGELQDFYIACNQPLIIDAGANIGAASVWFSLTFPKATILAIEPEKENFEYLKRNVVGFPTVLPFNAAIASATGTLNLTDPGRGAWAYRTTLQPSKNSFVVPAMSIEDLLSKAPDRTPFILKIDIEGAESDLFSRHSPEFERFPIIAIELHDWMLPGQANSLNFLRWHVEKRRDLVFQGENVFSIANDTTSPSR